MSLPIEHTPHNNSLYIIGYGVNFVADRSVVAEEYIKKAEIVFALETDVSHLECAISGRPVVNLIHLYKQGLSRSIAYEMIADAVLEAFLNFRRVALLVEGSPFFLDSICGILESKAIASGIEVTFVDGRSSLDVLVQTLEVPLDFGIGVYSAEAFCIEETTPRINTDAVNLFFQTGNVGSSLIQIGSVGRKGVETLQIRLLEHYPPDTRWLLINLGHAPNISTMIVWNYLSNMHLFHAYMHSGTVLVSRNWWPETLGSVPPTKLEDEEMR